MISATSRYAMRALIRLAQERPGAWSLGRDLAREAHVPEQYLPKLMLMLRHAGLVAASRGTRGGYRLDRPAAEIHLRDVVEVFEGPLEQPDCLLGVNPECTDDRPCSAHAPWKKLRDAYVQFLSGTTIGDLAASAPSPAGAGERQE
ncbi:MAG TPA: Rrf2 family transcriptional regulator [Terriglobales bacterium]|nr:Rrf2 family transcriptional regulator [Terriglobales bacterium]